MPHPRNSSRLNDFTQQENRRTGLRCAASTLALVLIWVASYPRSGNTLVRVVLRNVFGLGNHVVMTPDELVEGMPRVKLPNPRRVKAANLPDLAERKQVA